MMPLHLEPLDLYEQLREVSSVLIISCPVCPPVSLATDRDMPLMEFFKHGIKTPAYEDFLAEVRQRLEKDGIETGVFTSYLPCAAACLWTAGQRDRLRRRAGNYDAALVMGCESALLTVRNALKNTDCEVHLAMELVGITNANLRIQFPLTIHLDNQARVHGNEKLDQSPPSTVR